MPPPITRFAPSPTGHLHIGGARTALFAWAFARRHQGHFILRVEDTDQARSSEESARGIMQDLAWLGLHWDEGPQYTTESGATVGGDPRSVGPFFQSDRLAIFNDHIDRLIQIGRAYHAFESPEELEEKRKAALAAKQQYRYDRAALDIAPAERERRAKAGEPSVIRFLMPDQEIRLTDEVLGEVVIAPGEIDDFVIRKRDGFPTYHLAVVVDDELMGVTHVIRGQEHLYNTPRHVALQRALGFRTPKFAHLPLIFNPEGAKMSKREKDKAAREACKQAAINEPPIPAISVHDYREWLSDSRRQLETTQLLALADHLHLTLPEIDVDDFRSAGYLPEVICNYIALLGWSPPPEAGENVEKFDMDFLTKWFDLSRIGKTNARFDRKKLLAFSNDAITAMPDGAFESTWREWCNRYAPEIPQRLGPDRFRLLAAAVRPRSKTLRDAADQAQFTLTADDAVTYDEKAVEKNLLKNNAEGLAVLKDLLPVIEKIDPWTPEAIHAAIESFAGARSLNMGKVAQPLRIAVTGATVSPPIDATLAILGKQAVTARLHRCAQKVAGSAVL